MTFSLPASCRAPRALLLLCLVLLQVLSPFLHLHDHRQEADAPLAWHVLVSDVALPAADATPDPAPAWRSPDMPALAAIIEVGTAATATAHGLAAPPLLPYYLLALVLLAGLAALLPPVQGLPSPRPGVRSPLSPRAPPRA